MYDYLRFIKLFLFGFIILIFNDSLYSAQGIRGYVTDVKKNAIQDTTIKTWNDVTGTKTTKTNTKGYFYIELESDIYEIKIIKEGYVDKELSKIKLEEGKWVKMDITLEKKKPKVKLPGREKQELKKKEVIQGIKGYIMDNQQNPIEKATIKIWDKNTKLKETETDNNGYFQITLVPGSYFFNVAKDKYEDFKKKKIKIKENKYEELKISLKKASKDKKITKPKKIIDVSAKQKYFQKQSEQKMKKSARKSEREKSPLIIGAILSIFIILTALSGW